MNEPRPLSLEDLKRIEAEMIENKASIHGIVHVIVGDHPEHGCAVIVRDDRTGFIFATPIPPELA